MTIELIFPRFDPILLPMKRSDHPGYPSYHQSLKDSQRVRKAIASWKDSGQEIEVPRYGLQWRPDSLQQFVKKLAGSFQAYNQVLWQVYPYCTTCRGGCCLIESPRISPFDMVSLAILDEPYPTFPENSQVLRETCVYLLGRRCSWPAAWRTMKCWTFYCLGGEGWQLSDPHDIRYRQMAEDLKANLRQNMPPEINVYEVVTGEDLAERLIDPLDFADSLNHVLEEIFVQPFDARFPLGVNLQNGRGSPSAANPDPEALALISRVMDQFETETPELGEQILADLETIEMLVLTGQKISQTLLADLNLRYQKAKAESIEWAMGELVRILCKKAPTDQGQTGAMQ